MLLFSPNWLFLYPGIVMMLAGLAVGGLLLGQPIYINSIRLGLDTLVYCCTFVIAGFQAILFSMLSRMYAIHEGLYPQTARDHVYGRLINLERGLVAGAGILLIGLATALYAVWDWKQHAFGNLDTERIARVVLPSSVAISLGIEIILFSFLLSTFGLKARPYAAMVEEIERIHASSTKSSEDYLHPPD
jgi:hypothetical protein